MGIADGSVDLNIYAESLHQSLNEVMSINKILSENISSGTFCEMEEGLNQGERKSGKSLVDDVLSSLDFE